MREIEHFSVLIPQLSGEAGFVGPNFEDGGGIAVRFEMFDIDDMSIRVQLDPVISHNVDIPILDTI